MAKKNDAGALKAGEVNFNASVIFGRHNKAEGMYHSRKSEHQKKK
jgi:hypothetical protein